MTETDHSRRRFLSFVALLASSGVGAAESLTNSGEWVEGVHYFRIRSPQPIPTSGKIEVLDVFSYACPACNAFEPTLDRLEAALPSYVRMAFLPAGFNSAEDWPVFQRAYLTAQLLGVAERSHDAMYDAVWGKGSLSIADRATGRLLSQSRQPTIADVARFYARYGLKEQSFLRTARSPAVDSLIAHSDVRLLEYGVDSTPTLIVDGKYRLTPVSAGGYSRTIDLVLYLVARERSAQKGSSRDAA